MAGTVGNTLFLGFWTSETIPGFTQSDYMGTYAALGVASGIFSFILSLTIRLVSISSCSWRCSDRVRSMASLTAGLQMFKDAFTTVIRSPVSFFDTTPLGKTSVVGPS